MATSAVTSALLNDENPEELLDRCRRQDVAAWRQFYELRFAFVYRAALRLGAAESEVDDVAQEVFLIAFRKIEQFREGRVTTWLYQICVNLTRDRHRRLRVRRRFQVLKAWFGQAPLDPPDRRINAADAKARVRTVLSLMSSKHREVLVLQELEGLSTPEIAERVQCPATTVFTRLYYARKQFVRIARELDLLDQ